MPPSIVTVLHQKSPALLACPPYTWRCQTASVQCGWPVLTNVKCAECCLLDGRKMSPGEARQLQTFKMNHCPELLQAHLAYTLQAQFSSGPVHCESALTIEGRGLRIRPIQSLHFFFVVLLCNISHAPDSFQWKDQIVLCGCSSPGILTRTPPHAQVAWSSPTFRAWSQCNY